ncbi:MAG: hypothetical protein PHW65_00205 [Dehalococcoidales bacterium]|nr:hypothetical protein [Dehalococcoidales bacterium]
MKRQFLVKRISQIFHNTETSHQLAAALNTRLLQVQPLGVNWLAMQ